MESKMIKINLREDICYQGHDILLKVYTDTISKRKFDCYGECIHFEEPVLVFVVYKPSNILINKFISNKKVVFKEKLSDIIYLSQLEYKEMELDNDIVTKFINEEKGKIKDILKALLIGF